MTLNGSVEKCEATMKLKTNTQRSGSHFTDMQLCIKANILVFSHYPHHI